MALADHKPNLSTETGADLGTKHNSLIDELLDDNTVGDYKHSAQAASHGRWLLCDGSAVSRTTYSDLFALIGTAFGVGDGSTTFNLPDAAGKGIIVYDSGDGDFDIGDSGGEKEHTLTNDESPSHDHYSFKSGASGDDVSSSKYPSSSRNYGNDYSYGIGGSDSEADVGKTSSSGGGNAHNNLQPYIVIGNLFISFM